VVGRNPAGAHETDSKRRLHRVTLLRGDGPAAAQHMADAARHLEPLERRGGEAVVERVRLDRPLLGRIPDNEVGVRACGDRALARREPERLRRPGGEEVSEPLERDTAARALGEDERTRTSSPGMP